MLFAWHAGDSPNWHLDNLQVTDTASGITRVFVCREWLGLRITGKDSIKWQAQGAVSAQVCPILQAMATSGSHLQLPTKHQVVAA